jgi:hypothetical protein
MFIRPSTLKTSNLSKLLKEKWFDKKHAEFQVAAEALKLDKPSFNFEGDQETHAWVKQSLKAKDYISVAYLLSESNAFLNQSPMAYVICLGDVNLVMAMLAFEQDVNGQYYKDLDSTEFYYPLTLAMTLNKEYVFNLLLLHPQVDPMYEQAIDGEDYEDYEDDVFIGQGYQYESIKPFNRLFDTPYHDALPYLNIDLDRYYDSFENTLFLRAYEYNDVATMELRFSLGANIFVKNDDYTTRFTYALDEYKENGSSKTLDWYAEKLKPIMEKCIKNDGGLAQLFTEPIDDKLIEKFGLIDFHELIEDKNDDIDQLKRKQERANYRVFYPNLFTSNHIEPDRLYWLRIAEEYVLDDLRSLEKRPAIPHKKIEPISVFDDLRRIYPALFASAIQDLKISMVSNQLELTIQSAMKPELVTIEVHLLPEDVTRRVLDHNFFHKDLTELTSYQLMALFLNCSLDELSELDESLLGNGPQIFDIYGIEYDFFSRKMFNSLDKEHRFHVRNLLKDLVI